MADNPGRLDYTFAEFRALTKEELIAKYDHKSKNVLLGLGFINDEIARRDNDEQTAEIVKCTKQMTLLTWAIAGMTLLGMAMTGIMLWRG